MGKCLKCNKSQMFSLDNKMENREINGKTVIMHVSSIISGQINRILFVGINMKAKIISKPYLSIV